jgi:hypothetical protein
MKLGSRERHPLCTCPELTWDAATGRAPAPDLDACRARAFGGIDPHPVLTADDLRAIRSVVAYAEGGQQ